MIVSIRPNHFFSLYKPGEIILDKKTNVLIGINGSGKSNFIRAIELLHSGVTKEKGIEQLIMNDWGGLDNVVFKAKKGCDFFGLTFEFDKDILNAQKTGNHNFDYNLIYSITIASEVKYSYSINEMIYINSKEKDRSLMQMSNGGGYLKVNDEKRERESFKSDRLVLGQISDPQINPLLYTLKLAIEKIKIYKHFDTTLESPIRRLSPFNSEKQLLSNGENLVHILQHLFNNHSIAYNKIEEQLRKVNPHFNSISFALVGSRVMLVLKESGLNKSIPVEHISDGTLRFLLLMAILYNPDRGNIVCLDEPEMGLHPDMINTLAEGIKYAAQDGTQMIIATHSPILLNSFDVEDLLIFEKDQENCTVVSTKNEADFADWSDQYLTGQAWLSGKLGGTRW